MLLNQIDVPSEKFMHLVLVPDPLKKGLYPLLLVPYENVEALAVSDHEIVLDNGQRFQARTVRWVYEPPGPSVLTDQEASYYTGGLVEVMRSNGAWYARLQAGWRPLYLSQYLSRRKRPQHPVLSHHYGS